MDYVTNAGEANYMRDYNEQKANDKREKKARQKRGEINHLMKKR